MNFNEEDIEILTNGLQNMHEFLLKQYPHVKKYYKWRKVHSEILSSMGKYINNGNYDLINELTNIQEDILKEVKNHPERLNFDLDTRNEIDNLLFVELCAYKNHPKMLSLTEEFLRKNKLKNEEKVKLLNAMNDSFISFFKIDNISIDGYVDLIDLVTDKVYRVIDVGLSNPLSKKECYLYSRIFSVDGINFASTLFIYPKNIKVLNNYIKSLRTHSKSNIVKTLEAYDLYKNYGGAFKIVKIQ